MITDDQCWLEAHTDDLWIFNKLHLSRVLGYNCGPAGLAVPKPDFYCVRPCMNIMGMGIKSRIEWIDNDTSHLHPGEFWCEVFNGEHLSVDYKYDVPVLVVSGERDPDDPLYKWKSWKKINKNIEFPEVLKKLKGKYSCINCEFIDQKLIEVHFRENSDFRFGNSEAIPVWNDQEVVDMPGYIFVQDADYERRGFYIK